MAMKAMKAAKKVKGMKAMKVTKVTKGKTVLKIPKGETNTRLKKMDLQEHKEDGENDAASEDATPKPVSLAQEARSSAKEVARTERTIAKLQAEKAALAQKLRSNGSALRRAEQELEELQAVAKKSARKVAKVNNEKAAALLAIRTARFAKSQAAASKAAKIAKKRADVVKEKWAGLQEKLATLDKARQSARAKVELEEKNCKALAAKGHEVPKPSETHHWEFSAPTAVHAPGVEAAKARHVARQALAKAEEAWGKVAADSGAREEKFRAAKEKLDGAKQRRKEAEELLANPSARVMKRPAAQELQQGQEEESEDAAPSAKAMKRPASKGQEQGHEEQTEAAPVAMTKVMKKPAAKR